MTTSEPGSTNTGDTAPTEAVNTPQTLEAVDTNTLQPENGTVANTGLTDNQEVQELAAQAGVEATDSPEVAMAKMLQQSSDNKDANTINATNTQTTANRRLMSAYSAEAPQSTTANTTTATEAAPVPTTFASPAQGTTTPIVADALANGYIKAQTDATNAPNTLSGRAWVVDNGTPATMSNGLTAVPEGTDVYMQWIDTDGAVSPVYTAKTSNQISSSDGSQVGPGAYAFDLREGWEDLNGKTHKYTASGGQDYRLWINDYQTENGNTATMLRQAGGFFPGAYVDSVTNSNLGQFPLIGTNMQRTGIFMAVKPTSGYMTTPEAEQIHDTEGPISAPSVSLNTKNTVSGKVWLETGAGDYANSATGPNDNAADPQADGYTVVMSSLTKEGADAYNAEVNSLPESERSAAAKTLLEAHPEYISATVYGETDQDGKYTLRFPEGTLNPSYMYGYVKNPEGNIVNTYSSFTNPEFRAPNTNLSWTPQTSPAQNLVQNPMWYNVNFAVVPTADISLDVLKYDAVTTPAAPGANVDIALPGTTMSPLPTHIEWRDSSGNVLVKTPEFTTTEEGEQLGKFQVPTDAQTGSIYTAYLVSGGNDVAADSFIVQTFEQVYDPTANEVTNPYNTPTTENQVIDNVTIPDYPADQTPPTITVDDPTTLPDGTVPGTVDVPVTVTYPDGTSDKVNVPVTTATPQSDQYDPIGTPVNKPNGTPTTENDVTGNVTVPNYPADQTPPTITVDDPTTLPDGNTPGTVDVPVTVTYPDGSTDKVNVPVITGDTDASQYDPTSNPVNTPYGTPTTEDDVTGNVTVPDYPADQTPPTITVDDPTTLPDGTVPGTVDVPVTVTYPDGSIDQTTVSVTTGNPQADTYDPTATPVNKPNGTPTTEDDVTGNVTVPGYPADQTPPTITVDDPTTLPDGTVPGTVDVPVTVTYPDGSTDNVNVPVTTGTAMTEDYTPTTNPIEQNAGVATTENDVTSNVTIPNYPAEQSLPQVTVNDPSTLPDGTVPGTVDVPATVTYPDGSTDQVNVPVTTRPAAPEINPIETGATTVTGNGYPSGTVTVYLPDGTTQTTQADTNGAWTVESNTPLNTDDVVSAFQTVGSNYSGQPNESDLSETTVADTTAPDAPPINPIESGSTTVTGTGEPNGTITVTYPDGATSTSTVDQDGNWTADVPEGTVLNPGDSVTATQTDESGNVSTPSTEVVKDTAAPDAPPINPIESGATTVTGIGNPGDTITVTYPNGSTSTSTVDQDGNWTTDVPEGTTLVDGDRVTATATDESGNVSTPSTGVVTDTIAPDAPPINPIESGATTITGTGEPNSTVTVTYPDGSTSTSTVDQDGNWTTNVPEGTVLNPGDNVTATQTDKAGNTSTPSNQVVTDTIAPDAPPINPAESGATNVTGTGNPGDTITVTFPNGNTATGTVDNDGNWTVDVPADTPLNADDVITATATDESGNTSTESSVTVTDTVAPDAPVIDPVDEGATTVTGTGTPGDNVTVTFPDGNTATGTVDNDGNWTVDVPEGTTVNKGDVITATATDEAGNTSDESSVTVTGKADNATPPANDDNQGGTTVVTPEPPVINQVPEESPSVTGTATPGNTVEVTFPDGHTETATVNQEGGWSVPAVEGKALESGEVITAVETDKAGNTSKVVRAIVGDNTGSEPAEEALPDTGQNDNAKNATLFGSLFALLGSIFLFGKRRKEDKEK
ncbi:Ig-like domain-containing protein [Staphylococcus sp. EZ-P03]|uniref:Ig-like domain-containing protein n=1 Tax=Staphylococcus sp. EZ-P03 TaxID=2282739 RepID=UPI000DF7B7FE|nr:Ig-like domain-containing protein [Staphylococcus sp. EZ-P03]